MLHRKWCCICNIFFPRKHERSAHIIVFFFRAIPVAALSTHCKTTSFGRWCLSVVIWCSELVPKFFFEGRFWRWHWINSQTNSFTLLSPLMNESALAESIVTQLIHALVEWLRQFLLQVHRLLGRYPFVVAMMNAIMCTRSIQQVS